MRYDMKIKLPYHNLFIILFFFLTIKFADLISYPESKARPPSAPNVLIWIFLPVQKSRITHVIL